MNAPLARYEAARHALAEAHKIDEVKDIRDKAVAMEAYAKQARDTELIGYATEIRMRAERRAGELLLDMDKNKGAAGGGTKEAPRGRLTELRDTAPKLADLGITKAQSSRWQKVAGLEQGQFEAAVERQVKLVQASAEGDGSVIREIRAERQQEKRERREAREAELGAKQRALPGQKFGVVLADPEWSFEPWSRDTGMDRAADNHYPTNPTEVIAARDVASIAADDCVLFLWATVPMLPEALVVLEAWGFRYKSHFVWAKDRIGTGYWSRNAHELLLVGTRGKIPAPAMGTQWNSLLDGPVGRHSEKPEIFYKLIEHYFPSLPKIELNARSTRPGWSFWGNEVSSEAAE